MRRRSHRCHFCGAKATWAYRLDDRAEVPFCLHHLTLLYFGLSLRTSWG